MLPKTPRRIGRESSIQRMPIVTVERPSTLYSWAALRPAFSVSLRPRYWLAMTAPPVASALSSWIISTLKESTRLTPETAASPTEETIRVSARPMEMLRACSATSGRKSEMSC